MIIFSAPCKQNLILINLYMLIVFYLHKKTCKQISYFYLNYSELLASLFLLALFNGQYQISIYVPKSHFSVIFLRGIPGPLVSLVPGHANYRSAQKLLNFLPHAMGLK